MTRTFLYTTAFAAVFAFGLSANVTFDEHGLSVGFDDAKACYYAGDPDCGDGGYEEPTNGDGSSCITCEGGSVMLEGAAATMGEVITAVQAPEDSDHVDVEHFAVQVQEGQSNVDLTIGTDGTFDGTASAWQMSYGGQELYLTNSGGGDVSAGSAMKTGASAAVGLKAGAWE